MQNEKLSLIFLISLTLILAMYILFDTKLSHLEQENLFLRDTLNEQHSTIFLQHSSTFDKEL